MAITWTLNGAQIALAPDDLDGLDAFVQAHGPGVPSPVLEPAPTSAPTSPTPAPVPALSTWQVQIVDDDARKRIDAQHAVLTAAGYAVGTAHGQAFTNGTRMAAEGYAVQQGRAVEHAAKLPARDAIHALVTTIRAERREDIDTSAGELARAVEINGALKINGLKLREHAIRGLLTRLRARRVRPPLVQGGQSHVRQVRCGPPRRVQPGEARGQVGRAMTSDPHREPCLLCPSHARRGEPCPACVEAPRAPRAPSPRSAEARTVNLFDVPNPERKNAP
jgi:hypothetical protein